MKVAALKDAGKSEDLFQALGDPLKRQLVGKWSWRTSDGSVDAELRSDATFTAENKPDKKPEWKDPARWVTTGKGNWSVRDQKLTITMTQVWAVAFWKDYPVTWFDNEKIAAVKPTQVELEDGSLLQRQ